MKGLRNRFERFCYRNREKGIPNLMLYIVLGSGLVYLMTNMGYTQLYSLLCFDRAAILQGQIWRLFTYALTFDMGNVLYTAIGLLCYYSLGRAIENSWGTLRFNLFYFTGVVMMDIFCMIFGGFSADVYYLNLSLLLSYATMYPDSQFLLFFIKSSYIIKCNFLFAALYHLCSRLTKLERLAVATLVHHNVD